jgi:tRNA-Thr(GGU) m(6)t(6)A37 methyltransferase TsaA
MEKKDFTSLVIKPIAYIHTDFPTKFGIPRQGDVVSSLTGTIIFEEEYRKEGILRGLEDFSHLWLIWGFSDFDIKKEFSPTIRPPKLGGNTRVGVFASRSPNRPNPLGISAVKIEKIITEGKESPIILVSGVDLMDGTPIYDIKPYIPFSDAIVDAKEGYTAYTRNKPLLKVVIPEDIKEKIPSDKINSLIEVLSQDPRPGFHHDENRVYGFAYLDKEVKFHVEQDHTLIVDDII